MQIGSRSSSWLGLSGKLIKWSYIFICSRSHGARTLSMWPHHHHRSLHKSSVLGGGGHHYNNNVLEWSSSSWWLACLLGSISHWPIHLVAVRISVVLSCSPSCLVHCIQGVSLMQHGLLCVLMSIKY